MENKLQTDTRTYGDSPFHAVTPLVESSELRQEAGGLQVLLKLDNVQPSGSFKIRGIGNLVQKRWASCGVRGVVSSSGGNAGLAAAYAAARLGLPATVVVPKSTHALMVDKLKKERATVEVHGSVWNDANARALELVRSNADLLYVHPFDHPLIWDGVSSLVDEVVMQCGGETPSCFVLSVGGGGLLCGVIQGLIRNGLERVPIVAMETQGAHCLNAALKAGKPVSIGDITSLAKTLGALSVTEQVFELLPRCSVISRVVSDKDAVDACYKFLNDHRYLVEPSCGAALAALYSGVVRQLVEEGQVEATGGPVVVVVCGGNAVTLELLQHWRQQTGLI
ncbi:Tryptophan synthase beta subunit-like PLP-dependent enzyme [Trinorchestia longiramus]|nr:Tryptophan synthase beta subunit-like PLP-dependent enzyme [Trinorchestia longiramus]